MKVIAQNKKAFHEYEILEKYEAGVELTGHEAKSAKSGRINLAGSYVLFRGEEAYMVGAGIPSFQPKNAPSDYDPKRSKKLLLKKSELKYLNGKTSSSSLTIIPLRAYIKNGVVKIEIGLAKKKKKHDKREQIKKRDMEREIQRELRRQME